MHANPTLSLLHRPRAMPPQRAFTLQSLRAGRPAPSERARGVRDPALYPSGGRTRLPGLFTRSPLSSGPISPSHPTFPSRSGSRRRVPPPTAPAASRRRLQITQCVTSPRRHRPGGGRWVWAGPGGGAWRAGAGSRAARLQGEGAGRPRGRKVVSSLTRPRRAAAGRPSPGAGRWEGEPGLRGRARASVRRAQRRAGRLAAGSAEERPGRPRVDWRASADALTLRPARGPLPKASSPLFPIDAVPWFLPETQRTCVCLGVEGCYRRRGSERMLIGRTTPSPPNMPLQTPVPAPPAPTREVHRLNAGWSLSPVTAPLTRETRGGSTIHPFPRFWSVFQQRSACLSVPAGTEARAVCSLGRCPWAGLTCFLTACVHMSPSTQSLFLFLESVPSPWFP